MPTFSNPDALYRGTTGTVVPATWTDLVNDDLNALYGDTAWTVLPLGASIAAFGGGFRAPSFQLGGKFVYLAGVALTSGSIATGATIGTLPVGYRPPTTVVTTLFNVTGVAYGQMRITSAGLVQATTALATAQTLSFDGTPPFCLF